MEYICSQKLHVGTALKSNLMDAGAQPTAVPGECGVYFLLRANPSEHSYAQLSGVMDDCTPNSAVAPDGVLLECDGLLSDESLYQQEIKRGHAAFDFAQQFGTIPTASALHCAAAALLLKHPDEWSAHLESIGVRTQTRQQLSRLECVRYRCNGQRIAVGLNRVSC